MSSIQPPARSENIGTFNGIAYVRHQGQFVGQTQDGRFAVPYEITVPAKPAEGHRTFVFEPPHFTSGPIARDVILGPEFLWSRGFSHAAVGYSNLFKRILDPNPGFQPVIKNEPIKVILPGQPGEVTDTNILRQFAFVLKQSPPSFLGQAERIYAIGFSDSGNTVHKVYEPFGHKLFDLSFACTAPYYEPVKISGQKPIIVFNTEADFDARARATPNFPQYRWYTVAGGPHIPDAVLTRKVFTGGQGSPAPPIAGTSPLNWLPIIRGLFMTGDQWIRQSKQPPASATLEVNAHGQLKRDALGNALGGIRHPALVAGETRFLASVLGCNGWRLFGGYDNVKRLTDCEFSQYLNTFTKATEALLAARFLLPAGRDRLLREAQLHPPDTYTVNYQAGRLL